MHLSINVLDVQCICFFVALFVYLSVGVCGVLAGFKMASFSKGTPL